MPKKRVPDLPLLKHSTGAEYTIAADPTNTYACAISGLNISHNAVSTNTGLVTRSLSDHFSDVINVKDYGAVGDYENDDTHAIQAAAAAAENKVLFFPAGNYRIFGAIELPSDVTVTSANAQITQTANNTPVFKSISNVLRAVKNITIENLVLRGLGQLDNASVASVRVNTEDSRACGVYLVDVTNAHINRCVFLEFKNAGIFVFNGKNINITNNVITGIRTADEIVDGNSTQLQYAVALYSTSQITNDNGGYCSIHNNVIANTGIGVYIAPGYIKTRVSNNVITNISLDGITASPSTDLSIESNTISSYNNGIHLSYNDPTSLDVPKGILIRGNNITDAGIAGINLETETIIAYSNTHYLQDINIQHNNLQDLNQDGIVAKTCRDLNFTNNILRNVARHGIVYSNSDGSILHNSLTNVKGTAVSVVCTPLKPCFVESNTIVESSNEAPFGYIDVNNPVNPLLWQSSRIYPVDSLIVSRNNIVYKSINAGTALNTGFGPDGVAETVNDNNIVWKRVGPLDTFNTSEVFVLHNNIVSQNVNTPQYGIYGNLRVRINWKYNNLPTTKIINNVPTTTPLRVYLLGTISGEKDNKHGGHLGGNYYNLAYDKDTYGTPYREIIGADIPVTGDWQISDRVWNTQPAASGYIGWVCVRSGSGTDAKFVPFGYLGVTGSAANLSAPSGGANALPDQVVIGSDTRLVDARTPKTHSSTHSANGTDPINPADIGAMLASHNLSEITNPELARMHLQLGTFAVANLPESQPVDGQTLTYNTGTQKFEWQNYIGTPASNKFIKTFGGHGLIYTITHPLNTRNITAQVYHIENNGSRTLINYGMSITSANEVVITVDLAPAPADDKCVVVLMS